MLSEPAGAEPDAPALSCERADESVFGACMRDHSQFAKAVMRTTTVVDTTEPVVLTGTIGPCDIHPA